MTVRIIQGDCRVVLRTLADASVHSVVTDPPYELGFMGKAWDSTGIAYDIDMWRECLRVLKPGGYLLAFGSSRTYHRIACAVEDAGFDIRDQIMWLYGSGFPKSLDVSKAIDKAAGASREVLAEGKPVKRMIPGADQNREGTWIKNNGREFVPQQTAPATDTALQWEGFGTALKPAHEPIVVARKPLIGTVAESVQLHGCGALNIEACRIASPQDGVVPGRWPANVIHDGSEEVLAAFPDAPGQSGPSSDAQRTRGNCYGALSRGGKQYVTRDDAGSAARFFYCAKASREDRNAGGIENPHPTVKPTELMRYLCRLVTPQGGVILDPFAGSGSTGRAADIEGFDAILIERDPESVRIAQCRIAGETPFFTNVTVEDAA